MSNTWWRALATVAVWTALAISGSSQQPAGGTNTDLPRVRFETTLGSFTMVVEPERAPITVANFLKYVDGGFYENGRVHRATRADNYVVNLPNRPLLEVIQAGIDPAKQVRRVFT